MSVLSFDSVGLWLFCVKERKENEPGFEIVLRTKENVPINQAAFSSLEIKKVKIRFLLVIRPLKLSFGHMLLTCIYLDAKVEYYSGSTQLISKETMFRSINFFCYSSLSLKRSSVLFLVLFFLRFKTN